MIFVKTYLKVGNLWRKEILKMKYKIRKEHNDEY